MIPPDQSFPKSTRLTRQPEFERVHRSGIFAADGMLVVKAQSNGLPVSRLGLAISRRAGNAVVRNRWKRRIREAFRRQRGQLPVGIDLVVRPRKGAEPDTARIATSLRNLAQKIERQIGRSSGRNR